MSSIAVEYNGSNTWIAAPPTGEAAERLKAAGFRWSSKRGAWWQAGDRRAAVAGIAVRGAKGRKAAGSSGSGKVAGRVEDADQPAWASIPVKGGGYIRLVNATIELTYINPRLERPGYWCATIEGRGWTPSAQKPDTLSFNARGKGGAWVTRLWRRGKDYTIEAAVMGQWIEDMIAAGRVSFNRLQFPDGLSEEIAAPIMAWARLELLSRYTGTEEPDQPVMEQGQ